MTGVMTAKGRILYAPDQLAIDAAAATALLAQQRAKAGLLQ
jgi:hypothetical protein